VINLFHLLVFAAALVTGRAHVVVRGRDAAAAAAAASNSSSRCSAADFSGKRRGRHSSGIKSPRSVTVSAARGSTSVRGACFCAG
jgi:hypothetical protein